MSRVRSLGVVAATLGLLSGGLVIGAGTVSAAGAPSLSVSSMKRSCDNTNLWYQVIGFVDNLNGQQLSLEFALPDGSDWTSTSFTPTSDHYAVDDAFLRQHVPSTNGTPPWPVSVAVALHVKDASGTDILQAPVDTSGCPQYFRTDFDGDGSNDIVVFRPSTGQWFAWQLATAPYADTFHNVATTWGKKGDIPVAADYNGDGAADYAVFRPSNGTWYVKGLPAVQWGKRGDVPVPGLWLGDNTIQLAVYRPSNNTWYVRNWERLTWGHSGDVAVPGDYNGNFMDEHTVFRPSNGTWYNHDLGTDVWGKSGDIPVASDYTGDGLSEVAVWRPSNGTWYLQNINSFQWGKAGDVPVPSDYFGEGGSWPAVFRPSNSTWYLIDVGTVQWGRSGDIPIKPMR